MNLNLKAEIAVELGNLLAVATKENLDELGRVAYEGFHATHGPPIVGWQHAPESVREPWVAAAAAVSIALLEQFAERPNKTTPKEIVEALRAAVQAADEDTSPGGHDPEG